MDISPREWYLKWLKGSVEAYLKYRVSGKNAITLENILGRFRKVIENGYLTREEALAAIDQVVGDPLLIVPIEAREAALKPLREAIMRDLR